MLPLHTYLDRGSIRFKLFRLVTVVAAATLLISMVGGALFEWNNQQRQLRQSLATIAQAAGLAASAAVAFHDSRAAGEALRILAAEQEIEAAAVYPLEGYRLAGYGDETVLPRHVDQESEHLPSFNLFVSSTSLFQPIRLDEANIGHIFIRVSLQNARINFLMQAILVIGVNLLGFLLVLRLGLPFLDSIVKPVKELADVSQLVRMDKSFSRRVAPLAPGKPHDEIGELIESFNAMLAEIEQRDSFLAIYQTGLEAMVYERTESLRVANQELRVAKEAADVASQAKSRFLAAASHDLRQPLQAINLFQNALHATALNPEQKNICNYLSQASSSLGELLNTLLDISKIDGGVITPRPEIIGVHDLFGRIDTELAPLAAEKSLRFRLRYPASDIALFTDEKLLKSLLHNLIGNAIKYTEQGGVLVAVRQRGEQALVQIWDSGIGIAPEHMEAIFDEYFQVANAERDRTKGLGLGLAIVRRLAKLLDTDVVCRSRPGRGSVFEFRLPLAACR
jgi:signal transduction histidine kinase